MYYKIVSYGCIIMKAGEIIMTVESEEEAIEWIADCE